MVISHYLSAPEQTIASLPHSVNSVKFCNSVAMGTGPRKAGFDVNDGGPDAPLSPPVARSTTNLVGL